MSNPSWTLIDHCCQYSGKYTQNICDKDEYIKRARELAKTFPEQQIRLQFKVDYNGKPEAIQLYAKNK